MMGRICALLFLAALAGCSSKSPPNLWDAARIAAYPNDTVLFKDKPKGKVVAEVRTSEVRQMIRIKEQVEEAAGPIRARLLVEDSTDPNGFSTTVHGLPVIAINVGMINLLEQDEDAMAALIGHELAHLYLGHGALRDKRENKRLLSSLALSFTLGMIGIPLPADAAGAATTIVSNTYSRDEEREADRLGVEYMAQAGFDPWGAAHLIEKLDKAVGSSTISFFSTHPGNTERINNLRQLATEYRQMNEGAGQPAPKEETNSARPATPPPPPNPAGE